MPGQGGFVLVESMHQDRVYSDVSRQAQDRNEKLLQEHFRLEDRMKTEQRNASLILNVIYGMETAKYILIEGFI